MHEQNQDLPDLSCREKWVLLPVVAMIILIGVAPGLFLDKSKATVDRYVSAYQERVMSRRNRETLENAQEASRKKVEALRLRPSNVPGGGPQQIPPEIQKMIKEQMLKMGPVPSQMGGRK